MFDFLADAAVTPGGYYEGDDMEDPYLEADFAPSNRARPRGLTHTPATISQFSDNQGRLNTNIGLTESAVFNLKF